MQLNWIYFCGAMPDDATESVATHSSRLCCNHQMGQKGPFWTPRQYSVSLDVDVIETSFLSLYSLNRCREIQKIICQYWTLTYIWPFCHPIQMGFRKICWNKMMNLFGMYYYGDPTCSDVSERTPRRHSPLKFPPDWIWGRCLTLQMNRHRYLNNCLLSII